MKLQIIKQEVLDDLKNNVDLNYQLYFIRKNNEWIRERYDSDPFITFKDVPDFKLADLDSGKSPGEIDLENCKIIYQNLSFLTESQASDERLWAGLAHGTFYDYMRSRWNYDKKQPYEKSVGEIETRYFFKGHGRGGFFRHTLAKCWWTGRAFYDAKHPINKFHKLDTIGPSDLSTKVNDILYSYTFSSNNEILDGIVKCYQYFNEENIKVLVRDHVRPSLQLLNAIGGGIVLDYLSADEIAEIMIENIESVLNGDTQIINYEDVEELESTAEHISNEEETQKVAIGSRVHLQEVNGTKIIRVDVDYKSGSLLPAKKELLGKSVGESVIFNFIEYIVSKIELIHKAG